MDTDKIAERVPTTTSNVGDAVGVEKNAWYVAIVGNNTEKSSSTKLTKLDYECYVPIQQELRVWKNGKRSIVDKVLIPTIIFIHCTEKQRKVIVSLPFINRFMINKAGSSRNSSSKPIAIIPERQIDQLKFMIGNSDTPITIANRPLKKGDSVRVVRGKLAGLEGEIMDINEKQSELIVALDFFGCAKLEIDPINVEKIN